MQKQLVVNDEALLAGAEAIAADMKLPGGRRLKLAKIINGHLEWFDLARRRGLEWSDIVDLLFKAGVTRSDGRPLSRGHVSSLVRRKQRAREDGRTVQMMDDEELPPALGKKAQASLPKHTTVAADLLDRPIASSDSDVSRNDYDQTEHIGRADRQPNNSKMIAFMKRAARVRKGE